MKIAFNDLNAQWKIIKDECVAGFDDLFERSNFILGNYVGEFESGFAKYIGCKYAVGVSNGTDALKLAAQSLDLKGSTCYAIPAYTFIASLMGVEQAHPNAAFNLIDCDEYYQLDVDALEKFVSDNRKSYENMVIVPVHLYGYTCNMDKIMQIAEKYNCRVLEDTSQAHGAKWRSKTAGSFGDVSAFSLYPGKNLGAAGDAGIITTNNSKIYERLLKLRNLGSAKKYVHDIKGGNHRLDTIQAIVLKEKIKYIEEWNEMRRQIVSKYESTIKNENIILPKNPKNCIPVHHVYPVRVKEREQFTDYLTKNEVQWGMHYPICIEEMPMYSHLSKPNKNSLYYGKEVVSLPIHPFMKAEEVDYLCDVLNKYKKL